MSAAAHTTRIHTGALIVRYAEREFVIPAHFGGLFAIGRGPGCQIVLDSSVVSRLHGCIRVCNGVFLYRDTSSNGTILLNGHDETLVQDAEIPLPEAGTLRIGEERLRFQRNTT